MLGKGLTDVGTVNEAKEVEQSDSRDDVEINLETELPLGHRIILHKGLAISEGAS